MTAEHPCTPGDQAAPTRKETDTWHTVVDLEDAALSETGQLSTSYKRARLLIGALEESDSQGQEAGGAGELCFTETEFQFGEMRRFWRWIVVTAHNMNVLNAPELCP